MQQEKDNARYELSLALRTLLKVFKATEKTKEQQRYYDAADAMLKKHSKITDVLRTESNEQPVEQKGVWVKCSERFPENSGIYKVKREHGDEEDVAEFTGSVFTNYHGYRVSEWKELFQSKEGEQKESDAVGYVTFLYYVMANYDWQPGGQEWIDKATGRKSFNNGQLWNEWNKQQNK